MMNAEQAPTSEVAESNIQQVLNDSGECTVVKVESPEDRAAIDPTQVIDLGGDETGTPYRAKKRHLEIIEDISALNDTLNNSVTEGGASQPKKGRTDIIEDVGEVKGKHQTEEDVGITAFISNHEGFQGIFKQRYSDFLVNEIDKQGVILRLTDISHPEQLEKDTEDNEDVPDIDKFLNPQKKALVLTLLESDKRSTGSVSVDIAAFDKKYRSDFHLAIRMNYPKLMSSTVSKENGERLIIISHKNNDHRERNRWPKNRGKYLHFILYKENIDTIDAVGRITQLLNTRNEAITYAGTKDKRAKTCQMMCLHNFRASRMFHLNNVLRHMKTGNYSYQNAAMKLGDLNGNHFTIIIRSVTGTQEQIDQGMASLIKHGFINYYGMQRFGTTIIPTYAIGKALLKNNWNQAIDLILMPRGDNSAEDQARVTWTCTKDAEDALHQLSPYSSIEKQLIQGLVSHHKDPIGALSKVPRKVRHLYLHSYQSRLWNRVVSKRLHMYGLKPVLGDMVLDGKCEDGYDKVKHLTEEELHNYSIYDIVLTIPGYSVVYPDNALEQVYKDLLAEDGFILEPNKTFKNKILDYSLSGGYRKILVKPTDVKYSTMKYSDPKLPLVNSDLDTLMNETLTEQPTDTGRTALKLEFSLPSSCYATMVIREVMKCDTTILNQSKLTQEDTKQ